MQLPRRQARHPWLRRPVAEGVRRASLRDGVRCSLRRRGAAATSLRRGVAATTAPNHSLPAESLRLTGVPTAFYRNIRDDRAVAPLVVFCNLHSRRSAAKMPVTET